MIPLIYSFFRAVTVAIFQFVVSGCQFHKTLYHPALSDKDKRNLFYFKEKYLFFAFPASCGENGT